MIYFLYSPFKQTIVSIHWTPHSTPFAFSISKHHLSDHQKKSFTRNTYICNNKNQSNTTSWLTINAPRDQITANGENGDIDLTALSQRLDSFNRVVRNTAAHAKEQPVAESKSDKGESSDTNTIATAVSKEDTSASASDNTESKAPAIDELTLDDEPANDEDRNKR